MCTAELNEEKMGDRSRSDSEGGVLKRHVTVHGYSTNVSGGSVATGTQESLLLRFVISWVRYSFGFPETLLGYLRGRILVENNIPIVRKLRQEKQVAL